MLFLRHDELRETVIAELTAYSTAYPQQIQIGDFGLKQPAPAHPQKLILLGLLLFACSLWLTPVVQHLQHYSQSLIASPLVSAAATSILPSAVTSAVASSQTGSPPATSPPATSTSAVPNCQRGGLFTPGALDLAALGTGPHTSFAGTSTYAVHGLTAQQISNQMAACSPVNQGGQLFDAATMYYLSTSYSFAPTTDSQCTVTYASVGINISQTLPAWTNTGASSSVANQWNSFLASLKIHENGHVAIDQTYAAKVYADMMGIAPTACGSIDATIKAVVAADTAALNAANVSYDVQTNHGATQGASL